MEVGDLVAPTFNAQRNANLFYSAITTHYDTSKLKVLSLFPKGGELIETLVRRCKHISCWERNGDYVGRLHKLGIDKVQIVCPYKNLQHVIKTQAQDLPQWDMIIIDTPPGWHTDALGQTHYEHFDFLQLIAPVMADRCLLILTVIKDPIDIGQEEFEKWMRARRLFYGTFQPQVSENTSILEYRVKFASMGYLCKSMLLIPGPLGEGACFRVGLELVRETIV